jgi:hypothetical protein
MSFRCCSSNIFSYEGRPTPTIHEVVRIVITVMNEDLFVNTFKQVTEKAEHGTSGKCVKKYGAIVIFV